MPRSAGVDLHRQAEVFVTGPFPPPVHGMAVATARLATRLGTRFDVRRFDIAARPRSGVAGLDVLLRVLASFGTLARYALGLLTRRPQAVVVAMSAGFAKTFDLFAIAIALSQRRVVYVTHHSFAVFDGRTRQGLLGACRPMLRRCRHIVLCDAMKTALCGAWQLRPDSVFVLSNAALMDSSGGPVDGARVTGGVAPASATCRLGFIANLCADKGLWTFLDVVECAQRDGCPVTALIAGPVEPPDAQLERALRNRLRRIRMGSIRPRRDLRRRLEDDQRAAFVGDEDGQQRRRFGLAGVFREEVNGVGGFEPALSGDEGFDRAAGELRSQRSLDHHRGHRTGMAMTRRVSVRRKIDDGRRDRLSRHTGRGNAGNRRRLRFRSRARLFAMLRHMKR